jgi:hypothetical protein
MDSEHKTLVIFDTNKIRNNFEWEKDYSCFEPKGDFLKIIEFIEKNKLEKIIFIGLPEIVVDELVNTRSENFNRQLESIKSSIKKLGGLPCCNFSKIKLPKEDYNYRNFIKKKIKAYINDKKFILILNLEKSLYKQTLQVLIEKATQKKQPFGESKKGFKDALIWEIVLNTKDIDKYFTIFILSENEKDFDFALQEEFKIKFSKDLNLEFNTEALIVSLENIYGLYIKYPDIIEIMKTEYFKEILTNYISDNFEIIIKNFEIINILNISEVTEQDLEDFGLGDLYQNDIVQNFKFISLIFINDDKKYESNLIIDLDSKEILGLTYEKELN